MSGGIFVVVVAAVPSGVLCGVPGRHRVHIRAALLGLGAGQSEQAGAADPKQFLHVSTFVAARTRGGYVMGRGSGCV